MLVLNTKLFPYTSLAEVCKSGHLLRYLRLPYCREPVIITCLVQHLVTTWLPLKTKFPKMAIFRGNGPN